MTIYIVSGFMRSGTSMMMQALESGGLEAVYNPSRDKMNDDFGDEDYKINDGGFYELTRQEYMHPDFPDNYDGKLVKCLWGGMIHLKASSNLKRIIFMRRPIDEIARSYEAAFDYPHPAAIPELAYKLAKVQGILEQRRDVDLKVIQYHDVLSNPRETFESLGWPIDAEKAAAIVKPELHRHRAAKETYGVQEEVDIIDEKQDDYGFSYGGSPPGGNIIVPLMAILLIAAFAKMVL